MSFETTEDSIEDGQPVRLYRFTLNDHIWRYANCDGDITIGGFTWLGVPIRDDGIAQTGESSSDALTIEATNAITPAQLYMKYPPARPVQVVIFDGHVDGDEIRAVYAGEITQCNVLQPGRAVFTCETIAASMEREGLRLGWQRACPYAMYDPLTCKVNKAAYVVTGVVTTVEGNLVVVNAFGAQPNNRFAGGFVEWIDPVRGIERRGIESQVGGTLFMFGSADGITAGLTIMAYPGCNRTTGEGGCASFDNLPNYGGAPALQGKSPFDGSPVFN